MCVSPSGEEQHPRSVQWRTRVLLQPFAIRQADGLGAKVAAEDAQARRLFRMRFIRLQDIAEVCEILCGVEVEIGEDEEGVWM